jgi:hypothetical protein
MFDLMARLGLRFWNIACRGNSAIRGIAICFRNETSLGILALNALRLA